MGNEFVLGSRSKKELKGVHPQLVDVVKTAITITEQDFSVHDGIRTLDEQKALVARGASRTLNSKHRKQPDGYGHAVDLVPYVNGKLRWEWPLIYPIAEAMRVAANQHNVMIRWGGCWQVITGTDESMENLVALYVNKCRRENRSAFTDGPHFELRIK